MLNTSAEAAAALVASRRKLLPEAEFDLTDPDITYSTPTASGAYSYALLAQMYNRIITGDTHYATSEPGRWILDGSVDFFPVNPAQAKGEVAFIGNVQSNAAGYFPSAVWAQLNVSNLSVLQAASVCFTGLLGDGYAIDMRFDVYSGAQIVYTQTITDSRSRDIVSIDGFTVYDPTAIRVSFTRWSLPGRYARAVEIIAGIYEVWDNRTFYSLDFKEETDLSNMTLPYGTALIDVYNVNKRFNPRNKNGVFASLEERIAVPLRIGPRLPDGTVEQISAGVYYLQNGGWELLRNNLIVRFKLVDIIGLLANRKYSPPAILPTVASAWISSITRQLGDKFADKYIIDASLASKPLTCSQEDLTATSCGDLIRYICMAIGGFPRADKATGYLRISVPPTTGGITTTADNLSQHPTEKANDDVAAITFRLNDVAKTQYTIGGTSSASSKTLSIANPFIKTAADAQAAARRILKYYGGQKFTMTGRGDMRAEIGDMETVELLGGDVAGGQRYYTQFKMTNNGIVKDAQASLIIGTGGTEYANHITLAGSGTWKAPNGVTTLRIVLVQGGAGGDGGGRGGNFKHGTPGQGGSGGKIYVATITINSGQSFSYACGTGGAGGLGGTGSAAPGSLGQPGGETVFGIYSSTNGALQNNWIDLETGKALSATGNDGKSPSTSVVKGADGSLGSGDGGGGGSGGADEVFDSDGKFVAPSVAGGNGGRGGSGVILISYN